MVTPPPRVPARMDDRPPLVRDQRCDGVPWLGFRMERDAPRPLIVSVRREPFWGTMERVALCPGAFGKPRRRTSGFSKSNMTKPLIYRDVVSDAAKAG